VTFADALRPPALVDATASVYKDWLHLNVLDASSGTVGVFNVSLHGSPGEERSRAVGTALIHTDQGWMGNLEIRGITESFIGPSFVGLAKMGLAVVPSPPSVLANVVGMEELRAVRITATPVTSPVVIDLPIPFGNGWISWNVIPLLKLEGSIEVNGSARDLSSAWAYHDHNWGRWHWGDDVAWEWGCFVAADGAASFVFARTTDRAHERLGPGWLSVHTAETTRRFATNSIDCSVQNRHAQPLRRFPGALAALHQDRAEVQLPDTVQIRARDGFDHLSIIFRARSAAQLITADPVIPGYGFIHELPGEFDASGQLNGKLFQHVGLGLFEYVC
jgi:hypothetical protein